MITSVNTDSFISSSSVSMLFISFSYPTGKIKTSRPYWIEVMKGDILALFPVLGGNHSVFHYFFPITTIQQFCCLFVCSSIVTMVNGPDFFEYNMLPIKTRSKLIISTYQTRYEVNSRKITIRKPPPEPPWTQIFTQPSV